MLKNYCLFFLISSSFLLPLAISLIKHLSSVQVLAALYQTKHLPVSKLLLCAPLNALRGTTKISLMLPFTCMVLLLVNATQPSIPQKKKKVKTIATTCPSNPLLDTDLGELKAASQRDIYTPMFITTLFILAKR